MGPDTDVTKAPGHDELPELDSATLDYANLRNLEDLHHLPGYQQEPLRAILRPFAEL